MQEKLNAWQEAANRMREVTSIMYKSAYTAPELLDGLRARLIVALIAVADALGVKLVPDFSNVVVRQDGVPLEVETFPLEVVIVSQSRANLIEEKVRLVAVHHDTAVRGWFTAAEETAFTRALERVDALLSVTDEDAAHICGRFEAAARRSSKHKHAYSVAAALFRRSV
jgi:hypothetical protein